MANLARSARAETGATNGSALVEPSVDLTTNQLNTVVVEKVGMHIFPVQKEAVGNIDFDDDLSVQVFPNYQGKLLKTLVEIGDDVTKAQALYTIDSPDLVNAESTLIGAAATFELTDKELARARNLSGTNGVSQRELEQAINDQQTALGALNAAGMPCGSLARPMKKSSRSSTHEKSILLSLCEARSPAESRP